MPGPFVFFDLRSSDTPKARDFYTGLFGWTVNEHSLLTDENGVWGGFTPLPPGDQRRPQWTPYAPVDDLDAATTKVRELGGSVLRERIKLPGGSAAVIEDPTGASLVLWEAE
ncbi:VOC family protein [Fodinicola acaciae]|uniref:VOC family protein n=1 Tax=Fodinicola acaciae TaxID=2681555 RepID=UPI001C9E2496|nr:VOC family protein [Fodinicola acaciae]